jgi:hypothetical protein
LSTGELGEFLRRGRAKGVGEQPADLVLVHVARVEIQPDMAVVTT